MPAATWAKADRELAYLVCETFRPLGDAVACVLPDDEALVMAAREWAKGNLPTRLARAAEQAQRELLDWLLLCAARTT